jgi:hypothetical protein
MPDNEQSGFSVLKNELLRAGVAPRHVRRIVSELEDHVDDLQHEARELGIYDSEALGFAMRRIGDQRQIARRMLASTDLRAWIYRYPRIARIYLPVAYALLLPAFPVFAGLANPGIVLRWGAALMLSAGITAGMMLVLQLAIATT